MANEVNVKAIRSKASISHSILLHERKQVVIQCAASLFTM